MLPSLNKGFTYLLGGLGEFETVQTRDVDEGLYNFQEFSQPSECFRGGSVNTEKVLDCVYKIILKIRVNLKRHNRVYILSSKHTYRPMRARVVAHLFYKTQ